MSEEPQRKRRRRIGFLFGLGLLGILLLVFLVPSLVSISRYKNRIAGLVSASMGRPVHLSSVELQLLPRPGFVMTDLSVDEDPAYGAEPILHANSVTAAIRLLALLGGRIEISRISVDEASLNLVRSREGKWNFDALLHAAAARGAQADRGRVPPFPYLEATNSRVNLKNGLEKLPYSLVNADASLWQENPGDWRLRLRGQPARTDVSLDLADTGIVRMEASLKRAVDTARMPIHLVVDWREAQLGQLSRLVVGSDPGWRGNLTGELQLDGTTEAAQVRTRLSATGVHRAEFTPADPMDFDANCAFEYRYEARAVENLACDSPFGQGHVKLEGAIPAQGLGKLAVQVENVPVSAGLDAMRTLRNGIDESLEARGTITGQLTYDPGMQDAASQPAPARGRAGRAKPARTRGQPHPAPLAGSLTVDGFRLSGNSLSQSVQIGRIVFEPADVPPGQPQALTAVFPLPEGGASSVSVSVNLALNGYQVGAHGAAALARLRELGHVVGLEGGSPLDGLAGDPATLDLNASGPWLPAPKTFFEDDADEKGNSAAPSQSPPRPSDQVSGTITLHNANWKMESLTNHVEMTQATLHVGGDSLVWDPILFSYGPVEGNATLSIARRCDSGSECVPELDLRFAQLDAAELQAALLGAHQPDTVLSSLIARISPSSAPLWPHVSGTLEAETLILGPVTLHNAELRLKMAQAGAEITSFNAEILGGKVEGNGTVSSGTTPVYSLEGALTGLSGSAVCQLLGLECTAGQVAAKGKIELTGFSDRDLAASAKGELHVDWRHGAIDSSDSDLEVPKELARFDDLAADASVAGNAATIRQGRIVLGGRTTNLDATVTFANPPQVSFGASSERPPPSP
jgi:AsmA family/AsmA-like C-terminal region